MLGESGSSRVTKVFSSFAPQFLRGPGSFMGSAGLSGISHFLKAITSLVELQEMAQDICLAREHSPKGDVSTHQIIQHNLVQLFAQRHAQLLEG
jgi:hypothetical protein